MKHPIVLLERRTLLTDRRKIPATEPQVGNVAMLAIRIDFENEQEVWPSGFFYVRIACKNDDLFRGPATWPENFKDIYPHRLRDGAQVQFGHEHVFALDDEIPRNGGRDV